MFYKLKQASEKLAVIQDSRKFFWSIILLCLHTSVFNCLEDFILDLCLLATLFYNFFLLGFNFISKLEVNLMQSLLINPLFHILSLVNDLSCTWLIDIIIHTIESLSFFLFYILRWIYPNWWDSLKFKTSLLHALDQVEHLNFLKHWESLLEPPYDVAMAIGCHEGTCQRRVMTNHNVVIIFGDEITRKFGSLWSLGLLNIDIVFL